jgi:outer membrane protein
MPSVGRHEAIRSLLAGYAAGALSDQGADAVRIHLAGGCTECFRDVFSRPVGLPVVEVAAEPLGAPRAASARAGAREASPSRRVHQYAWGLATGIAVVMAVMLNVHDGRMIAGQRPGTPSEGLCVLPADGEAENPRLRSEMQKRPARDAICVEPRAGAKPSEERGRPRSREQVMRVAFRPSAAAVAGLTGKVPPDQKRARRPIAEAEEEVTRRFRQNLVPRLWQTADAVPLGEKMYEYVAQNRLGHTALSEEDLGRIKSILTRIRRKGPPEPPEASPGELALTLEDAVALALEENLRLKITRLNEEALETEIPRAEAIFHPLLGSTLTASREKTVEDGRRTEDESKRTPTAFLSENIPTGGNILLSGDFTRTETARATPSPEFESHYSVSVVQPLLRGGRIYVATRPIKDAQYNWRIAAAQLQADILTVTAQTKTAYYNAVLADKIIDVTQEAIARDEALIEASDALFKAGLVTKRDVFSAAILRADDEDRLVRARGDREVAQYVLSDVLGVSIGTEVRLRDEAIDFEPVPLDLATWIALANERRPEILAADEAVKKSWLDVRVAQNTLLPEVNIVGSYGRGETGTSIGNALAFRGDQWTTGLLFSYPLGNVAARSALSRAKLEHARLQQELAQTRRLVELQVRAAVIKLRTSLQRMKPLAVNVEQSEGKLEVAQARFALGLATNKDVTDAQESLLDAERDLLDSTVTYKIGLAELEASIAGTI